MSKLQGNACTKGQVARFCWEWLIEMAKRRAAVIVFFFVITNWDWGRVVAKTLSNEDDIDNW